jgi:diphosphomevalonate decarboxylase
MQTGKATALANANIAFVKYWGNIDEALRLPANGSISMNLGGLSTRTTVEFKPDLESDRAVVDGLEMTGGGLARISRHLDHIRRMANMTHRASVISANNFPTGAGIASSAAAFAALSLAATTALDIKLSERELSCLARLGSGSAARSIPGGFVEWYSAPTHEASYAETFADADHWPLIDFVAIVSHAHKATGSTEGHAVAGTSVLQEARVRTAPGRIAMCKGAILNRDFAQLAEVLELDSNIMHAVMMTSTPSLFYWSPETLALMSSVRQWRAAGIGICYTIDAGPNVHCICAPGDEQIVFEQLSMHEGVREVRRAGPGGPAQVMSEANVS